MANDDNHNPLTALRDLLAGYPRGHGWEIPHAVGAAIDELARRQGTLTAAYLQLLESFLDQPRSQQPLTMHPAALDDLAAMSDHAGMIARRIRSRITSPGASSNEPNG